MAGMKIFYVVKGSNIIAKVAAPTKRAALEVFTEGSNEKFKFVAMGKPCTYALIEDKDFHSQEFSKYEKASYILKIK